MSEINSENLVQVHTSYVERIHDFRKEQQTGPFILLGIYSLVGSKVVEMLASGKELETVGSLAVLASIATWVLVVLYLNHSIMVVVLAGKVANLERILGLNESTSFFLSNTKLRWRSFLVSLSLPLLLHLGLILFFVTNASLTVRDMIVHVAVDFVIIATGLFILNSIRRTALDPVI